MQQTDIPGGDEDMSAREFGAEELRDHHDFGNWPEWAGLAFTIFVVWLTLGVTG